MARLGLLAALLFVLAACGPARESGRRPVGDSPVVVVAKVAPSGVTTRIAGASPEQRKILLEALAGIGETKIDLIEVAPAEPGWVADPQAVGLGFASPEKELDMRSQWQAWLVAQVLAVRSSELGLPQVAYLGGIGAKAGTDAVGKPLRSELRPAATDAQVQEFVSRVKAAARDAKVQVDELRILKPLGMAAAITVRVSDPVEFLDKRADGFLNSLGGLPHDPALGGPPIDPIGVDQYLLFVDEKGGRIMELAYASLGEGSISSSWVRPDLAGCFDPTLGSTGYRPPPCPSVGTHPAPSERGGTQPPLPKNAPPSLGPWPPSKR